MPPKTNRVIPCTLGEVIPTDFTVITGLTCSNGNMRPTSPCPSGNGSFSTCCYGLMVDFKLILVSISLPSTQHFVTRPCGARGYFLKAAAFSAASNMEAYTAEDLGWARHSSPRLYPPSSFPWQGPDDVTTKRLAGVFGNTLQRCLKMSKP